MQSYKQIQVIESRYSSDDNIFLIKARLKNITEHPNRFSKEQLVQQCQFLEAMVEDLI